jgi:hypothetical protein
MASRTKNWLTALIIGFVTFAVFYPSLQHNFVYWDDNHFFLDNQNYRGLHAENFEWIFFRSYQGTGLYIPLTWLTWSADYAIWGMDPFGYHLTNSIIHAFSASLFFLLTYWLLSIAFAGKINDGPLRTGSAFAALSRRSAKEQCDFSISATIFSANTSTSATLSLPKACREYRLRRFPREGGHSELSKGHRLDGKSLGHRS